MALKSVIAALPGVPGSSRESMYLLYEKHFSNVSRENFLKDLAEKDWVIQLLVGNEIAGFSTQKILRTKVDGIDRIFLFSGDTIVDPAHWQDSKLAGSFGHLMLRLIDENAGTPIYWFLISKGFRTYRFLPVYFKCFYPVYNSATPAEYQALLGSVSEYKFGKSYDADAGLVKFGGAKDRLNPDLSQVPASRMKDPHVRFFLQKNPGYCIGDEMVCIADIRKENLNAYALRVIRNTRVEWIE